MTCRSARRLLMLRINRSAGAKPSRGYFGETFLKSVVALSKKRASPEITRSPNSITPHFNESTEIAHSNA